MSANVIAISNDGLTSGNISYYTPQITVSATGVNIPNALTVAGNTVLTTVNGGLGWGQTWQNVTGSRILNNLYTNSSSKPMFVSVTNSSIGANTATMTLVINGVIAATSVGNPNMPEPQVSGIVPPGQTYRVNCSYGGVGNWSELV